MKKTQKKTHRYTVTFTVETSREMKPLDLEEAVAAKWDGEDRQEKLLVDSYHFHVEAQG